MGLNFNGFLEGFGNLTNILQSLLMEKYRRGEEMKDWQTRTAKEDELVRRRQQEEDERNLANMQAMEGLREKNELGRENRQLFEKEYGPNPAIREMVMKSAVPTNLSDQMATLTFNDVKRSIANREDLTPKQLESLKNLNPSMQTDLISEYKSMQDERNKMKWQEEAAGRAERMSKSVEDYRKKMLGIRGRGLDIREGTSQDKADLSNIKRKRAGLVKEHSEWNSLMKERTALDTKLAPVEGLIQRYKLGAVKDMTPQQYQELLNDSKPLFDRRDTIEQEIQRISKRVGEGGTLPAPSSLKPGEETAPESELPPPSFGPPWNEVERRNLMMVIQSTGKDPKEIIDEYEKDRANSDWFSLGSEY